MTDEMLAHMCMLSSIKIGGMKIPRKEWIEFILTCDESDLHNEWNTISILAETCGELMKRAGIKPRFRVKATTA